MKLISCRISRLSCDVIHFEKAKQGEVKLILSFLSNDLVQSSNMTCFIRIISIPQKHFQMSTLQLEKQIEELKSFVEKRERLLITLQVAKTKIKVEVGRKNLNSEKV